MAQHHRGAVAGITAGARMLKHAWKTASMRWSSVNVGSLHDLMSKGWASLNGLRFSIFGNELYPLVYVT